MTTTFNELLTLRAKLEASLDKAHHITDEAQKVKHLAKESQPICTKLRAAADAAELQVADELWPLPKYREMLHSVSR